MCRIHCSVLLINVHDHIVGKTFVYLHTHVFSKCLSQINTIKDCGQSGIISLPPCNKLLYISIFQLTLEVKSETDYKGTFPISIRHK